MKEAKAAVREEQLRGRLEERQLVELRRRLEWQEDRSVKLEKQVRLRVDSASPL